MPEPIIIVLPVRRFDATGDCVGYDFIEVDASILVDGQPWVRPARD